jgi:hypothetical protein
MSAGVKVLVLGALGVGGLLLLSKHSSAASSSGGGVPPGWQPPAGATLTTFPATGPGGIAIKVAGWQAAAGQPPGRFLLVWDPNDPQSFVALFFPAATPQTPAVMATGTTTNTQLIMSTIPALLQKGV